MTDGHDHAGGGVAPLLWRKTDQSSRRCPVKVVNSDVSPGSTVAICLLLAYWQASTLVE